MPDLRVIDDGRGWIGNELEAVPGAFRCGRRNRDRDGPNLEEVSCKFVRSVVDADEALYDTAQLEIDRIDSSARKSKWPGWVKAVRNCERIENTDVLSMEFASARC